MERSKLLKIYDDCEYLDLESNNASQMLDKCLSSINDEIIEGFVEGGNFGNYNSKTLDNHILNIEPYKDFIDSDPGCGCGGDSGDGCKCGGGSGEGCSCEGGSCLGSLNIEPYKDYKEFIECCPDGHKKIDGDCKEICVNCKYNECERGSGNIGNMYYPINEKKNDKIEECNKIDDSIFTYIVTDIDQDFQD
tara:strand:+ start:666 stop:1241 length:576 start_codon:yes stop_codon:yes gene_type:complete